MNITVCMVGPLMYLHVWSSLKAIDGRVLNNAVVQDKLEPEVFRFLVNNLTCSIHKAKFTEKSCIIFKNFNNNGS